MNDPALGDQFAERVVAACPDVLYVFDVDRRENIFMNRSLLEILGYAPAEIDTPVSSTLRHVVHPEDLRDYEQFAEQMYSCSSDAAHELVVRQRSADGSYKYIKSRVCVFQRHPDGKPKQLLCTLRDVSEARFQKLRILQQAEELEEAKKKLEAQKFELEHVNSELRRLARTDGLTGLLNYRAFRDDVRAEMERASSLDQVFSCIMIDVDHFKTYNDNYGHLAGDAILIQIADILRSTVRSKDIVARYGGEEFAIVLSGVKIETAYAYAQRILSDVQVKVHGKQSVTASFGVAQWQPGESCDSLLKNADTAMYSSKHQGRNRVTIYEEFSKAA